MFWVSYFYIFLIYKLIKKNLSGFKDFSDYPSIMAPSGHDQLYLIYPRDAINLITYYPPKRDFANFRRSPRSIGLSFSNETITTGRSKRHARQLDALYASLPETNDPIKKAMEIKRKFSNSRFPSQKLYSPLKYFTP